MTRGKHRPFSLNLHVTWESIIKISEPTSDAKIDRLMCLLKCFCNVDIGIFEFVRLPPHTLLYPWSRCIHLTVTASAWSDVSKVSPRVQIVAEVRSPQTCSGCGPEKPVGLGRVRRALCLKELGRCIFLFCLAYPFGLACRCPATTVCRAVVWSLVEQS
jgi:hypothetical protein